MTQVTKPVALPDDRALKIAQYDDLSEFERLMRVWMTEAGQNVPDVPTLSTQEVQLLRVRLIREELEELEVAYIKGDVVEVFDAVLDLLYVVVGTGVAHGFNQRAGFIAVHNNNTDKLARGHKDEGGKFIKPTDHLPLDLHAILEMQWRVSPFRADGEAVSCHVCLAINRDHKEDAEPFQYLHVMCDGRRVKL